MRGSELKSYCQVASYLMITFICDEGIANGEAMLRHRNKPITLSIAYFSGGLQEMWNDQDLPTMSHDLTAVLSREENF